MLDQISAELGKGLKILTLGKWGGRELGINSDLDFVSSLMAKKIQTMPKLAETVYFTRCTRSPPRWRDLSDRYEN